MSRSLFAVTAKDAMDVDVYLYICSNVERLRVPIPKRKEVELCKKRILRIQMVKGTNIAGQVAGSCNTARRNRSSVPRVSPPPPHTQREQNTPGEIINSCRFVLILMNRI